MSAVHVTYDSLQTNWRLLQERWRASGDLWDDPVRRQFEREFWQEFERVVPITLKELHKLEEVLARARQTVR